MKRLRIDQRMSRSPNTPITPNTRPPNIALTESGLPHQCGTRSARPLDFGCRRQPVRQLTNDWALDTEPRWSPDGRTLYFSSDRTGITTSLPSVGNGTLDQVTNVRTEPLPPASIMPKIPYSLPSITTGDTVLLKCHSIGTNGLK